MFERNKNNNGNERPQEKIFESLQGLFIKNKQLSVIVSGLIFFSFTIFMVGYFWGQKNAVELFTSKIGQESFSDQIYSSVCSLCDTGEIESNEEDESGGEEAEENAPDSTDAEQQAESATEKPVDQESEVESARSQFFAQLVGFGTAHAAQQFVQKLSSKDITVLVKKRTSRTAGGKFISWYQVTTEKFDNKNELMKLVEKLKVEEKLKDIQIVTC